MLKSLVFICFLISGIATAQQQFSVFFDFNKDVPNENSAQILEDWSAKNKKAEIVKMVGYCDSVDKRDYNKDLAMRRINSVRDYLAKNEIQLADNVAYKALGKDFKLSKNQADNRKVEVFYVLHESKSDNGTEEEEVNFVSLRELVAEEKATLEAKFDKAKKGEIVRISNLNFYFNSEKLIEESKPLLDELVQIMLDNPKLRIDIHGHICCNPNPLDTKLSYRRAIFIFKYLINNGIEVRRLAYKGFGSFDPIYPLPEQNEKQRAANRRVEILIVDK